MDECALGISTIKKHLFAWFTWDALSTLKAASLLVLTQQLKLENLIVFFPTVGHGMIGFKRILLVKTTSVDATAAGTLPTTAGAAPKSLFPTKGYLNHGETLISSHSLDCFVEEVLPTKLDE